MWYLFIKEKSAVATRSLSGVCKVQNR